MLLSEAISLFLDAKYGVTSDANQRWYRPRLASLLATLNDVEIERVTTNDLRRWRKGLVDREKRWANHPYRPTTNGGLSPHTIRGYIRAVRALFNWLEAEGELARNPARRLEQVQKPQEPPKDISQSDALEILDAAAGNARDFAILRFLADTGCRVGGIGVDTKGRGGLRLQDLDLVPDEKGRYRALVREKGRGGQRKARFVYFGAQTAQALAAYLDVRPEAASDRVFLGQRHGRPGDPLGSAGIHRMIQRYARKLGIEGVWNPHAWRHAFAHGALRKGLDISIVSQILGHSGIGVTVESYGIWADEDLADFHAVGSWLSNLDDDSTEDAISPTR